jgi:hypothetical protein
MLLQDSYIWTVHAEAGGPIQAISIQTNMPALINTLRTAHNIDTATETQINSATPNINITPTDVLTHITYNVIEESDRPGGSATLGTIPADIMSHTYTMSSSTSIETPTPSTPPVGPFYYGYIHV